MYGEQETLVIKSEMALLYGNVANKDSEGGIMCMCVCGFAQCPSW